MVYGYTNTHSLALISSVPGVTGQEEDQDYIVGDINLMVVDGVMMDGRWTSVFGHKLIFIHLIFGVARMDLIEKFHKFTSL